MSMIQQLIAAVTNSERQIDDQIAKLRSFLAEIDNAAKKADTVFSGSGVDYGNRIIDQLASTKKQVEDTINRLENAKTKLMQVKMV